MCLKINILCSFCFLQFGFVSAQDTVFFARHWFSGAVNNVFLAKGWIYVKAGNTLYQLDGNNWSELKSGFTKPYVFYENGFFEDDFIPRRLAVNPGPFRRLIPQESLEHCTAAELGDRLFVALGGALYEYRVNRYYEHLFPDKSVRDIYMSPSLSIVCTYGGVFLKHASDSNWMEAKGVGYASGKFWRTPKGDFLLVDGIYQLVRPDSFAQWPVPFPEYMGKARKGVFFRDSLVLQMTHSICYFNPVTGLTPIYSGDEYTDIEVVKDSLLFSTTDGKVYASDGKNARLLCRLRFRVWDIFEGVSGIYLAGANGVYIVKQGKWDKPELVARLPMAVGVQQDYNKNLWMATYNGLFILPPGMKTPVPLIDYVEFNRGALLIQNDKIFAGSTSGLYQVDFYQITNGFLPQALNKIRVERRNTVTLIVIGCLFLLAVGFFLWQWKRRRGLTTIVQVELPAQGAKVLTAEEVVADIKNLQLQTVEALAAYYKTNPVQLNRMFKLFDTTPGKLLKKAKLELAAEMLQEGKALSDITAITGYSVAFLKTELKKTGPKA